MNYDNYKLFQYDYSLALQPRDFLRRGLIERTQESKFFCWKLPLPT